MSIYLFLNDALNILKLMILFKYKSIPDLKIYLKAETLKPVTIKHVLNIE